MEKDLKQEIRVAPYARQAFLDVQSQLDLVAQQIELAQLSCVGDEGIDVHRFLFAGRLLREREQVLH